MEIDNRLDFYNAVKKYAETIDTDDEFVIVMSYSKKLSDVITIVYGNLGYAVNLITDENPVYDLKQVVMNAALEFMLQDKELKTKVIKLLENE
jgi:aromatic ring-opening dioxygenase LigB subunit